MTGNVRKCVYRVRTEDLPAATKAMTYYGDCLESWVDDVRLGNEFSLVVVSKRGAYSFVERQWHQWIWDPEEDFRQEFLREYVTKGDAPSPKPAISPAADMFRRETDAPLPESTVAPTSNAFEKGSERP